LGAVYIQDELAIHLVGIAVRFNEGGPMRHIWPLRRGGLEAVESEVRVLSEASKLKRQYEERDASRRSFNADLRQSGSQAQTAGPTRKFV
jgi:hypothetical protein